MPSVSAVPGMSSTPSIRLDQPLLRARAHRREADAAVAGDDGGDAVPRRRLDDRVPGDLAVVVRVEVDEAGRDEHARSRRSSRRRRRRVRPRATSTILPSLIATSPTNGRDAGAVDDRAAGDLEVVHGDLPSTMLGSHAKRELDVGSLDAEDERVGISTMSPPGFTHAPRRPGARTPRRTCGSRAGRARRRGRSACRSRTRCGGWGRG